MLNLINIEKLDGNNFKTGKQQVKMHLGMLEFHITFKQPHPSAMNTDINSQQREEFVKWHRANQMSLLIMQNATEDHIRGGIPNCGLANEFMVKIEEKCKGSNKVETGVYLLELIRAKYDDIGIVRLHFLKLFNLANNLNAMSRYKRATTLKRRLGVLMNSFPFVAKRRR